jgi:DNA helicase-2/ATP-dependent DNA helicase PcrA
MANATMTLDAAQARTMPSPEHISDTSDELLSNLNPAQRQAVVHAEGPLLILAGAGSGKTRVITHRIAHLLRSGHPADSVLAITFTNKAAGEMKERTEKLCGLRSPWISTFHSFSARILRKHIYRLEPYDTSFTICDTDDCKAIVKAILKAEDIDPELWQPREVLAEISRIKNSASGEDGGLGGSYLHGQVLRSIYQLYAGYLAERNLLDFDDLLLLAVKLFAEHADVLERYRSQFRHVLIDEYQDTNAVQYRLGRLLTATHGNLCITGDPDQSIYSWRGADINNILRFEHDYPGAEVIRLEQNYRSTKNILHAANALIARNVERKPKELWTENPAGAPVRAYRFIDEHHEAREIASLLKRLIEEGAAPGDIAVFYRLNSISRVLEQELIYANLPYTIVGGIEFFQRKEIKDLIAYLRVLENPRDSESLKRIINVPARGIGKSTIEKLQAAARTERRGLLDVVLRKEARSGLGRRQAQALDGFAALYETLAREPRTPVEPLLRRIIEAVGYEEHLRSGPGADAHERLANMGELVGAAVEYDRAHPRGLLTGFLELAAILGDVDRWEQRQDRLSLMTLHAAKGLEFPLVVIAGVEDGILPLVRADDPDPDFEEERRLLYVGITRAREKLYVTHTACRSRFGRAQPSVPSRFLRELTPPGVRAADAFERLEMDLETEASLEGGDPSGWSRAAWKASLRSGELDFADDAGGGDGFEPDEDLYPPGARVWHDEYGEGDVVQTTGFGRLRRVTVLFAEAGEKQFIIGYSPLRRLR